MLFRLFLRLVHCSVVMRLIRIELSIISSIVGTSMSDCKSRACDGTSETQQTSPTLCILGDAMLQPA